MGRTTELRRELKRRFYPLAEQHGFSIDKTSTPFGLDFRRITPACVDVFDLRWEKYGRPRFVVNFGKCAGGGVTHYGEPIQPEKVLSYMGSTQGRLQPGSGIRTTSWFSQDRPFLQRVLLRRKKRPAAEVVDSVIALFPELEEWFHHGIEGPHIHLSPHPRLRDPAIQPSERQRLLSADPVGGDLGATFPVQIERALPSLKVVALLGVLSAGAALINIAITDAEAKQPWALLGLVLGIPGFWVAILLCLAAFSLRITDEKIEKVLANRWVVASKPLRDLRSAAVTGPTLKLDFADGSTIRVAAMPLRDQALLASMLVARCSHLTLR